jgi:hypothetical protein
VSPVIRIDQQNETECRAATEAKGRQKDHDKPLPHRRASKPEIDEIRRWSVADLEDAGQRQQRSRGSNDKIWLQDFVLHFMRRG